MLAAIYLDILEYIPKMSQHDHTQGLLYLRFLSNDYYYLGTFFSPSKLI